jgi:hypothetical protein
MPSVYQKASLKAVLGLFLDAPGHALPEHTQIKSASSLSRFFNHYRGSTRQVIRTARAAIRDQLATHPVRKQGCFAFSREKAEYKQLFLR